MKHILNINLFILYRIIIYFTMLSDSTFEAITSILQAVKDYNDYSNEHKRRLVLALSHLYMVMWTLDRLDGDMNSTFYDAQAYANTQFDLARAGLLPDLE